MTKIPTQDLIEEHGGIMLMLKIMDSMALKLKNSVNIDKDHLDKIVEFLTNFADKCHHGKEEDILFPELIKNPLNEKLVNELLGEHKTGRDFVSGISQSLDNYQPGNPDAMHIALNMEGYIKLLTEHIRKENVILFPIADKELSANQQQEIETRFSKLETEVMGI